MPREEREPGRPEKPSPDNDLGVGCTTVPPRRQDGIPTWAGRLGHGPHRAVARTVREREGKLASSSDPLLGNPPRSLVDQRPGRRPPDRFPQECRLGSAIHLLESLGADPDEGERGPGIAAPTHLEVLAAELIVLREERLHLVEHAGAQVR